MGLDRNPMLSKPPERRPGCSTPSHLHFCWIGPILGWAQAFAVLSASEQGCLDEITLHHTDVLGPQDVVNALASAPGVRLSLIDPASYLGETGRMLGLGAQLAELYDTVEAAAVRADILRAAILWREGGLYLDMDTVTVAPLTGLLGAGPFVASESIVWPAHIRTSRSPLKRARPLALDLLRKLLRGLPNGWRRFRGVEFLYSKSVTNSAMGSPPLDPFFAQYLRAMVELVPGERRQRCALGPHLLQRLLRDPVGPNAAILEPHVFHPFPPEISSHWFRARRQVALHEVLPMSTVAVHWYASVRTRGAATAVTPATIAENRDTQFYSALVFANIGGFLSDAGKAFSRKLVVALTIALLMALQTQAADAAGAFAIACAQAASQTQPVLRVMATGAKSDAGNVTFTLYGDNAAMFLKSHGSIALTRSPLRNHSAEACFVVPAPGSFAVAIYHDENNNHHFDRNFLGLPAESYGFSNNPTMLLGPPSLGAASISVKPGENPVSVRLN